MRAWVGRALVSLSVAVACARATDEDLIRSGDDDSGGTSGSADGGVSGFGGTPSSGGSSAKGGATTGGSSGKGGTGGSGATSGKGGTGAASGSGGTDAGGASDGGEGGADPCSVAGTPPALRVDFQRGGKPIDLDPDGGFHVLNGTSQAVPLSELTVRYWFHSEFSCTETENQMNVHVVAFQFDGPYAPKSIADVGTSVVPQGTGAPGCDAYFEFGFDPATGSLANGQLAFVGFWTELPIYTSPHNQTNDYSYGACTTAFVYWDKLGLYRNGRLVGGSEPGGGGGAGGEGGSPGGGMGGV